jgi:hypothetical protein
MSTLWALIVTILMIIFWIIFFRAFFQAVDYLRQIPRLAATVSRPDASDRPSRSRA